MDVTGWIGLRYAEGGRGPEAYDCLGLYLALVRAWRGVTLPDPRCAVTEIGRWQVALGPHFQEIDRASVRLGDALLFRMGRGVLHVGFALGASDMLHIEQDSVGSCIASVDGAQWVNKLIGVHRLV